VWGGKVVSVDDSAALKVPGVLRVVRIDPTPGRRNSIRSAASRSLDATLWAAIQGRNALKIVWDDGPNASYDSAAYRKTLEDAARKPGPVVRNDGDFAAAYAAAAKKITAEYYCPHLAHASMEAPAASARITGGKCEVWGCFQSPQAARDLVAKRLDMPAENVTVYVTLLGGGFGRKSKPDYGIEAAILSKAMDGKPVKVVWTRDDDLHNDYFHTVSVEHLEAGVDAQGKPGRMAASKRGADDRVDVRCRRQAGSELGARHGRHQRPLRDSQRSHREPGSDAHTRIGWFRSVSNIPHAFAVQSFVAELAAAAGRDPKDFLLEVIGPARVVSPQMLGDTWNHGESPERYPVDTGRLRGVAELAAKQGGWGRAMAKGSGLGIAAHYSFVTYVAAVVEVAVDAKGQLTIPRIDIAVDLRRDRQPRSRARADGGCLRHGRRRGDARRDHVQERPRAAGQLQRVRGDTDGRGSARDQRAHRSRRLREADGRRGRAGRAAGAACLVQRDFRGDGQADTTATDTRSAERLSA
jgi:isoquinoline 1-oxidoreductase beta subunit